MEIPDCNEAAGLRKYSLQGVTGVVQLVWRQEKAAADGEIDESVDEGGDEGR